MGDPPPPSGLDILVDEKKFNDLVTQQRGVVAVIRAGINVLIYVGFVVIFTALALGEPLAELRAFEGYVRRRFDTEAAMPLQQVESTDTFWQYVHRSLVPAIYGNDTAKYFLPDAVVQKMLLVDGEGAGNRLYGTVRMRMVKTQPNQDCKVSDTFSAAFPACYGPYVMGAEETSEYGPVSSLGEAGFAYTEKEGAPVCGRLACYGQGGFLQAMTSNYNSSITQLRYMEQSGWVAHNTRGVFVDFTIFNFNAGYYAVCSIMFEVAPSGRWVNTFKIQLLTERNLSPLGNGDTSAWTMLIGEVILLCLVFRYLLEEASEFIGCRSRGPGKIKVPRIKMEYFSDAWNILDWLNLLLIIATFGMRANTWGMTPDVNVLFGDPAQQNSDTFADFTAVAANVRTIQELTAFNAVLTWFKAVKYINIFPYISLLMQTVLGAQSQLATWFVIFFTSLVGFMLSFTLAFGLEQQEFSSPWNTFVFLVRTILGDADMGKVHQAAPLTGSIIIIMFVVVVFFTVMQLFVSIMLGALQDAKLTEDLKASRQWQDMMDRAQDVWVALDSTLSLRARFASSLPGLHARLGIRNRAKAEKENERDQYYNMKQQQDVPHDDVQALGAASPNWGRRKAAKGLSGDNEDSGSEPDLGPLRHSGQLVAVQDDGSLRRSGTSGTVGGEANMMEDWMEDRTTEEDVVNLVLDATRYVADGVCDRAGAARSLLFDEMGEAREILTNLNAVLEVLGTRTRDIELQQTQFTRHF